MADTITAAPPVSSSAPAGSVQTPALSPDQELAKIQSDPTFAGGTYYGRTPGGIADLVKGGIVSGTETPLNPTSPIAAAVQNGTGRYTTPSTPPPALPTTGPVAGKDVFGNPIADTGVGTARAAGGTYTGQDGNQYYSYDNSPVQAAGVPPAAPDLNAIRQSAITDVQSQIDGIKAMFATQEAAAKTEGENNLGRSRASDARSGTLGSDFSVAHTDTVQKATDAKIANLEQQMNAQISGVMSKAQARGDALAKEAQTEADKNTASYLAKVKATADAAKQDISTLAKGGTPLSSLGQDEINTLVKQSGYDPALFNQIYNAQLPQSQQKKYTYEKVGNTIIPLYVDPTTGKAVADPAITLPSDSSGNTYDGFMVAPDGTPIFYNKTTGQAKVADVAGTNSTNFSKPKTASITKPFVDGKLTVTPDDVSQAEQILDQSKGSDGFVDPALYQQMYTVWTTHGGTTAGFIKLYPPKNYINPANNTLPTYLRSGTAKKSSTSSSKSAAPWAQTSLAAPATTFA